MRPSAAYLLSALYTLPLASGQSYGRDGWFSTPCVVNPPEFGPSGPVSTLCAVTHGTHATTPTPTARPRLVFRDGGSSSDLATESTRDLTTETIVTTETLFSTIHVSVGYNTTSTITSFNTSTTTTTFATKTVTPKSAPAFLFTAVGA